MSNTTLLKELKGLTKLSIENTNVTEASYRDLVVALPNCAIAWSPHDPDRRAAEWVLSVGGVVSVAEDGAAPREVKMQEDLPKGWFTTTVIDLSSQLNARGRADDGTLKMIGELAAIERLYVDSSSVTDAGLVHLTSLTHLKELQVANAKITDVGLARLKTLPKLEELVVLTAPKVTDGITELLRLTKDLRVLGLTNTAVSDASMPVIGELKRLTGLSLGATRVSDAGL